MASKEKVSPVSSTDKTCKDKTDDYPGMVSQRIPEHMDRKEQKRGMKMCTAWRLGGHIHSRAQHWRLRSQIPAEKKESVIF